MDPPPSFLGVSPLPSAPCAPTEMLALHPLENPREQKTPENPCEHQNPRGSSAKTPAAPARLQEGKGARPGQLSPCWGSALQCPAQEQRQDRSEAGNVLSQPQGHQTNPKSPFSLCQPRRSPEV